MVQTTETPNNARHDGYAVIDRIAAWAERRVRTCLREMHTGRGCAAGDRLIEVEEILYTLRTHTDGTPRYELDRLGETFRQVEFVCRDEFEVEASDDDYDRVLSYVGKLGCDWHSETAVELVRGYRRNEAAVASYHANGGWRNASAAELRAFARAKDGMHERGCGCSHCDPDAYIDDNEARLDAIASEGDSDE